MRTGPCAKLNNLYFQTLWIQDPPARVPDPTASGSELQATPAERRVQQR
jgi:hypothetical protein